MSKTINSDPGGQKTIKIHQQTILTAASGRQFRIEAGGRSQRRA